MFCPRENTENNEKLIFSKYATLSSETEGRKKHEEKDNLRTDFQRDRDRIIHSKTFRRLKHKTQVFLSPESAHYRTRLTHTLEVSQIARTVARALCVNEDLTEAIALGHDLGHTPFGHAGERALNDIAPFDFAHYEQSVRICERLENNLKGLNLTAEVLDGIGNHTKGEFPKTLEGKIVRVCDRVAYINHDIDDAIRGGIISDDDIPFDIRYILGNSKSARISTLVNSIVTHTKDEIEMEDEVNDAFVRLHNFLFESVYRNPKAKSEETKVEGLVEGLYKYFKNNSNALPLEYSVIANEEGIDRAVVDYIAGMTDDFAVRQYKEIFIPKSWGI